MQEVGRSITRPKIAEYTNEQRILNYIRAIDMFRMRYERRLKNLYYNQDNPIEVLEEIDANAAESHKRNSKENGATLTFSKNPKIQISTKVKRFQRSEDS